MRTTKIDKNFAGLIKNNNGYHYDGDLKINGDCCVDVELVVDGHLVIDGNLTAAGNVSADNIFVAGDLIAIDVIANIVTVNGNATARTIRTKLLSAENVSAENIVVDKLLDINGNINVSGKIYAPLANIF